MSFNNILEVSHLYSSYTFLDNFIPKYFIVNCFSCLFLVNALILIIFSYIYHLNIFSSLCNSFQENYVVVLYIYSHCIN